MRNNIRRGTRSGKVAPWLGALLCVMIVVGITAGLAQWGNESTGPLPVPFSGQQATATPTAEPSSTPWHPNAILTSQDAEDRALALFEPTPITTTVRLVSNETLFEEWLESTVPEYFGTESPIWIVAFEVSGYRLMDLFPPMGPVTANESAANHEVSGYYYVFEANGGISFMEGVLTDGSTGAINESIYTIARIVELENESLAIVTATPFPTETPLP